MLRFPSVMQECLRSLLRAHQLEVHKPSSVALQPITTSQLATLAGSRAGVAADSPIGRKAGLARLAQSLESHFFSTDGKWTAKCTIVCQQTLTRLRSFARMRPRRCLRKSSAPDPSALLMAHTLFITTPSKPQKVIKISTSGSSLSAL